MLKLLINPFERILEKKLLLFGMLTLMIGAFIGYFFKGRYDGVLDVHFIDKIQFYTPLFDIIISVLCVTILLFALGSFINKKTRFIDVLITTIIAKIPFYFLPLLNYKDGLSLATNKIVESLSTTTKLALNSVEIALLVASSLLSLIALVWSIILLYNGFKTATNAKENKHNLYFVFTLIISEILSKTILYLIN
ncbi:MAG: hypothetical protein JNJ52_00305 [Flavobacterium sp.]|nr:hypothetical protein [Flavobacterium sp.]